MERLDELFGLSTIKPYPREFIDEPKSKSTWKSVFLIIVLRLFPVSATEANGFKM